MTILFWKQPFGDRQLNILLWGGWLLPAFIYFSYSRGLMHAYYLIMLAPALAALVGMGVWGLRQTIIRYGRPAWVICGLVCGITFTFQAYVMYNQIPSAVWFIGLGGVLFSAGMTLAVVYALYGQFVKTTLALLVIPLFIAPSVWSVVTTYNTSPEGGLPYAGPERRIAMNGMWNIGNGKGGAQGKMSLKEYLLDNTPDNTYLLATDEINTASYYIYSTGGPVLPLRGFIDKYYQVSAERLSSLVENGRLRYVLIQNQGREQSITQWLEQSCKLVDTSNLYIETFPAAGGPGDRNGAGKNLYDCAN